MAPHGAPFFCLHASGQARGQVQDSVTISPMNRSGNHGSDTQPGRMDGARPRRVFMACLCLSLLIHGLVIVLWPSLRQAAPAVRELRLLALFRPPPASEPPRPQQLPAPRPQASPEPKVVAATEVPANPLPVVQAPAKAPSVPVQEVPVIAAPPVPSAPARERSTVAVETQFAEPAPAAVSATPARAVQAATGNAGDADSGSLEQFRLSLISAARRYRRYPPQAMERGWQGRVEVRLEIGAEGQIRSASVRTSSGYSILDQQAIDMITRGKTLAPIPPALRGRQFTVDVPVIFDLRSG